MKKIQAESKVFGERLRMLRTRAGLSAESLAQAIQVSPSTYREWENGRAITGLPYKKLSASLGVSIEGLFDDHPNKFSEIIKAIDEIDSSVKKIRSLL